jgi:hypothetical protein
MVRAQMLSELEEIILFKQYADQPERQQTMRKTWLKRFGASILRFRDISDSQIGYKAASRMSKYGRGFFKCGHWF